MKTFALEVRSDSNSLLVASKVRQALTKQGLEEDSSHPEEVIVIGGDGTFLRAVHRYMDNLSQTSFIGIHTGTLGFYMDYQEHEVNEFLTDIVFGDLPLEIYPIMEAEVDGKIIRAVNEVRVENPLRTQNIDIYLNDGLFERFRGSGICVCSQLGSSAFNRSLGGAVLQKGLPLFEITEMAGIHHSEYHSLGAPFVVSDETEICLSSDDFRGAILGFDSNVLPLNSTRTIKIRKAKGKELRILRGKKITYFERLERLF
ncbi:MAG: NAD(+)/NADH kinase [Erysipelotrichaceae bacterium]|nr:NAD(+)/NADH kinase [Erysipelotrichaceae bacterium]